MSRITDGIIRIRLLSSNDFEPRPSTRCEGNVPVPIGYVVSTVNEMWRGQSAPFQRPAVARHKESRQLPVTGDSSSLTKPFVLHALAMHVGPDTVAGWSTFGASRATRSHATTTTSSTLSTPTAIVDPMLTAVRRLRQTAHHSRDRSRLRCLASRSSDSSGVRGSRHGNAVLRRVCRERRRGVIR